MIKYHHTELGRMVAAHGMDIHGGKGICLGPTNYIGRGYQAVPVAITVEGANILTRNLIIFGQGLMRCHPYLYTEMQAVTMSDAQKGLRAFDYVVMQHAGFFVSNIARSILLSLTGSRLVLTPRTRLRRYLQHATRFSSIFALLSDVAMFIYGARLKRKENLSARLGDVASYLYLISGVVKRYHSQGEEKDDYVIAQFACEHYLYELQQTVADILQNFKRPVLKTLLQWCIFPLGKRFIPPSDQLKSVISSLLLSQSDTRSRLIKGMTTAHPLLASTDNAFRQVLAAEPIMKKINDMSVGEHPWEANFELRAKAALDAGLITPSDYQQVLLAEEARIELLMVDDFSTEDLRSVN
jgi:acyl-CoA dehydrogenase